MAYWGMAMANVNNPKRAKGFLKEARKRDARLDPPRDSSISRPSRPSTRSRAATRTGGKNLLLGLETIVQEFPDDLDARAWLAMVTWQNGGQDGIGSRQAVDTLIDTVLEQEPMHPGAHHYRIHLWDGVKPLRAERSAGLYAKAAPGIAHAWHMPGHTYTGLKRYADAAYQQEGSARVDHAYMIRDRVMPFEIHNYAHNNQWLCTSYSHIGRVRDAIAVARNLVEQPRDPQKNHVNDGGSAQRSGRIRWAEVLARYELWDDLIAATTSGALDWSDIPLEQMQKAYTLGQAYAAKERRRRSSPSRSRPSRTASRPTDARNRPPWPSCRATSSWPGATSAPRSSSFAKATSMRPESLARAHLAARNFGFAESTARKAVDAEPQPGPAAGRAGRDPPRRRQGQGRASRPTASSSRWRGGPTATCRSSAGSSRSWPRWKADKAWTAPARRPNPGRHRRGHGRPDRPEHPRPAGLVPLPRRAARRDRHRRQAMGPGRAQPGKNVLVLFFLGGKCAHCMQQLQLFGKEYDALKKLNVEILAISTDDAEATRALKDNPDGDQVPDAHARRPEARALQAIPGLRRLREPAAARHLPDRRPGQRPVPADLGRPVPRRRVHQDRGGPGEPDASKRKQS